MVSIFRETFVWEFQTIFLNFNLIFWIDVNKFLVFLHQSNDGFRRPPSNFCITLRALVVVNMLISIQLCY
jgi:hypothetical protein